MYPRHETPPQLTRAFVVVSWRRKYLGDWKACFDAYDADKSGTIDMGELNSALQRMGYRLSAESFGNLVRAYDTDKSGTLGFDEFIRLFCELNLVTGAFAKFDVRREGRSKSRHGCHPAVHPADFPPLGAQLQSHTTSTFRSS